MKFFNIRTPRRDLNETIARSLIRGRSIFGGRNYQRFLVVGVARSGSTLLLDLLNAHRQVVAFGELFRGDGAIGWDMPPFLTYQSPRLLRMHCKHPVKFLEAEVFRRWPVEIAAVGFKLFYYHARTDPQAAVWTYLKNDPELAIIHIKRLNILEQYLSLQVAHATNIWSTSNRPCASAAPIRLEQEACLRHFEQVRTQEDDCDAFFAGARMETVTFEELVADRSSVMARVAAHLGLSLEPVDARIVRQRTQPVSTAIANYEELREFFAGSVWERFFHEPDTVSGHEAV